MIILFHQCVVGTYKDYTLNTILQRSFKYQLDIEIEIPKDTFILKNDNIKLFFYPVYEVIDDDNNSKSFRWIGIPCTYKSKLIFKSIKNSKNVKGTFSCNVNNDIDIKNVTKFNGIFYNKKCLESLHPNCYPKPKSYLININDESDGSIHFKSIKCTIQFINHYKGINEKINFLASGNSLTTQFNNDIGDGKKNHKILRLLKNNSIDETNINSNSEGISCNYEESNKKINCDKSNIFNVTESENFLKFHQYNQTHENDININYGIKFEKIREYEYELKLEFKKYPSDNSSLFGEVFFVTEDQNGKHLIKIFGGIVEFKKSGEKIKLKTKKVHYISSECLEAMHEIENTSIQNKLNNRKRCNPVLHFVKITFLQHNSQVLKNTPLKIYSLQVLSNITDPTSGLKKINNWIGNYTYNRIHYYQSYTFKKRIFTMSMREDLLEPGKVGDGNYEKYIDYTFNSNLQKGFMYNVDIEAKLTMSSKNSKINFYPAFSRNVHNSYDNNKNLLTWMGKPCTIPDKNIPPKNSHSNPNDIILIKVKCQEKDIYELLKKYYHDLSKEELYEISEKNDKFNEMFYEPVCLKKLHKDCWINNFQLLINFGDNNNINDNIYITSLKYSFTTFDLLSGKVKTFNIGHDDWKINGKYSIKKSSNIGILRLYTENNFITSLSNEELNCIYSEGDQRPSCHNEQFIDKKSISNKILFPNLVVSTNDIQIYGYNKKYNTIYDEKYNFYEVTFEFSQIPESECNILLEIFIVKHNEIGKIMFELYGGIIELNQDEFDNMKRTIYLKTKQLHFVDKSCKNNIDNNNDCLPIGNSIKVTFMNKNKNKCDNFKLKYVKILSLLKNDLRNFTNIKKENEINFDVSENIEFANTYAIYVSNRSTSVCLNTIRPWVYNIAEEEMFLLDPIDIQNNTSNKNLDSKTFLITLFILLFIGLLGIIAIIIFIYLKIKKSKKMKKINSYDNEKKNSMKETEGDLHIKSKSIKIANKETIVEEKEKSSDVENQENSNIEESKQHENFNQNNNKELEGNEENDYNEEENNNNNNDNNNENDNDNDTDSDTENDDIKGEKDKNKQNGKKQIPKKGMKNVGKKKAFQQKKKTPGGKKIGSKLKGKKTPGGKKATPKKVPPKAKAKPKQKPTFAQKGRRK